jgi:hypothetical protein
VDNAWFKPDRTALPIVNALKDWAAGGRASSYKEKARPAMGVRPISHYLLLPDGESGITDYHLDAIRPFINKYQPTIGFLPVEASHAKKVTIIGGTSTIPESLIDGLLAAGCIVEQISGDGMNIASDSASLPSG